jgi:hypothetical protein
MFQSHSTLASCMVPPIFSTNIKSLDAVVTIKGIPMPLKEFILSIPFPLVSPIGECGRPCIWDKKGQGVPDKNRCPKEPEQLIHQTFTDMSQGQRSAFQTTFLTTKGRLNVAKTAVAVLPAFVKFTTDACLEEWFDDTRHSICTTTTFMTDDNDNFNGKICTAADEEALALLGEDSGFGVCWMDI